MLLSSYAARRNSSGRSVELIFRNDGVRLTRPIVVALAILSRVFGAKHQVQAVGLSSNRSSVSSSALTSVPLAPRGTLFSCCVRPPTAYWPKANEDLFIAHRGAIWRIPRAGQGCRSTAARAARYPCLSRYRPSLPASSPDSSPARLRWAGARSSGCPFAQSWESALASPLAAPKDSKPTPRASCSLQQLADRRVSGNGCPDVMEASSAFKAFLPGHQLR